MVSRSKEESREDRSAVDLLKTARIMQTWAQCIIRVATDMKMGSIQTLSVTRKSSREDLERCAKTWGRACEDALAEYYDKHGIDGPILDPPSELPASTLEPPARPSKQSKKKG